MEVDVERLPAGIHSGSLSEAKYGLEKNDFCRPRKINTVKPDLVQLLVCPNCHTSLDLKVIDEAAGQVRTGSLHCRKFGCEYPISRFVPRFVNADEYADSFSKQRLYVRRHFEQYRNDSSGEALFAPTTSFDPMKLCQGLTLEVGCGYGRFIDVVQRFGGTIVGIDLSTHSIDLSQDFVGSKKNVHLVQCDLFHLPFPEDTFARIYSIGVLHHTPSPREAFGAIIPYLKQHGQISIWVYPPNMNTSLDRWRVITTKVPYSWLYRWCIINQTVFSWIRSLPGGWRFNWIVPGCNPAPGRPFWMRVMSDFDGLSPQHASAHSNDEVLEWFRSVGLRDVQTLQRRTAITGWKP